MSKIKKNNDLSMKMVQADLIMVRNVLQGKEDDKVIAKYLRAESAYHLQQAAEKLIKIQIYSAGIKVNHSKMYKHSLVSLIQYAQSENIVLNIPKIVVSNAQLITDWEALGRYEIHLVVRTDTLNKFYNAIEEWYKDMYDDGFR
ncbi:MAG: hypothetical protein K6G87_13460 [Butyrivibrio sp.]|uniref:hypothetical protein n=1 Tax=Butyrivibrio sp. TaxID=28121 RepID=UPI0025ED5269|nr:hypothetical protein [Butyrivibrio sp.]MCR5772223.1 hypothetical protein [Butyrivibrio sp.]